MKLVLTGWKPGLKKISLDMLLVKRLNVSIVVAKKHVDDLLAGEVIELEIDSASASDFVEELEQLGVTCHTEPAVGPISSGQISR
jgi:hypothetical protein